MRALPELDNAEQIEGETNWHFEKWKSAFADGMESDDMMEVDDDFPVPLPPLDPIFPQALEGSSSFAWSGTEATEGSLAPAGAGAAGSSQQALATQEFEQVQGEPNWHFEQWAARMQVDMDQLVYEAEAPFDDRDLDGDVPMASVPPPPPPIADPAARGQARLEDMDY
jgi:hypothetical protein